MGRILPRTFLLAVARKNFSALLARPVLLNGCPRLLSNPPRLLQIATKPEACSGFGYLCAGEDSNLRSRKGDWFTANCN